MKRLKKMLCAVLVIVVLTMKYQTNVLADEEEELVLHARSAVLMDADSGRILYEKDADLALPMASTTKILTCILALENGTLSDICTFSRYAASQPQVHLGAPAGTEFQLEDLLYSLMLESHNDSAVAIAEQISGDVETFAARMNRKAADIGCRDSWFVTPNGLDATVTLADGSKRQHSTTAADLARIMRYCVYESPKRGEFLKITQSASHSFADVSGTRSYYCGNHNALLQMLNGAVSGKTGFTGEAGYCYVAAYENEGRRFVAALLGCGWPPHKGYKWEDVRKLFSYGTLRYAFREIPVEQQSWALPVTGGVTEEPMFLTDGLREEERCLRILLSDREQVTRKTELPDHLDAPVGKGEAVGRVLYLLNGEVLRAYPLYTTASREQWSLEYCIRLTGECFLNGL